MLWNIDSLFLIDTLMKHELNVKVTARLTRICDNLLNLAVEYCVLWEAPDLTLGPQIGYPDSGLP
jgi:hypothetical protein